MKSDVSVAIVGGGFSGTILAAQLARLGINSSLIDGTGRIGRGVAYSTTEPVHLLNVRAEGMSAWSGEPDHFAQFFAGEGGGPRDFAQRRLFGRYLDGILADAEAGGRTECIKATAQSARREKGGWSVALSDGGTLTADCIVLAIGNQPPDALRAMAEVGPRHIAVPWGEAAQAAVSDLAASGDDALLIGTGLTMVDVVLSLDAAGHQGRIIAVSRRGLIPRSHADFAADSVDFEELPSGSLLALLRWLRRQSAVVGWRAAIDSLRPHSHALWQSLDGAAQRRFLRHARPWWDVHRHRIAPDVAQTLARLVGEGRLEIVAGRIVSAQEGGDGLDVAIRRRGSNRDRLLRVAYAFNCTGPLHSIGRTRDPLLASMLGAGEVTPDHLGIGLEVDDRSRAGQRVWALGPLTKGRYWEIVAVPDIREQAAMVAQDIRQELGG
jgi:uncharacterized NAD(P)/FAD-binding protein YdhS